MSLFGLGIGIMLANFHMWGIMFLLRAAVYMKVSPRGPMCFRCLMLRLSGPTELLFLVVFFFSKKLPIVVVRDVCPSVRPSVRPSVCPSVRLSVRLSSVEIISFRGNLLSNRPINLKIGLNVREGVVHVRKV